MGIGKIRADGINLSFKSLWYFGYRLDRSNAACGLRKQVPQAGISVTSKLLVFSA
jgi:hypothetical protein